jgi:hypothetical protein
MGKFLGGALEDFREPADSFLMRHAYKVVFPKDISQAVWAGVDPLGRSPSDPKVTSPGHKRQREEGRNSGNHIDCCQSTSSPAREIKTSETASFDPPIEHRESNIA